jgi:hypothetical protein
MKRYFKPLNEQKSLDVSLDDISAPKRLATDKIREYLQLRKEWREKRCFCNIFRSTLLDLRNCRRCYDLCRSYIGPLDDIFEDSEMFKLFMAHSLIPEDTLRPLLPSLILKYEDSIKGWFITGKAGTGKTWLLREIIECLEVAQRQFKVMAPTGVAAINVDKNASTIHSGLGITKQMLFETDVNKTALKFAKNLFDPSHNKKKWAWKERVKETIMTVDFLIIDEISMVSDKMLRLIDAIFRQPLFRRKNRQRMFGGASFIFFGDFLQLPPVSKNADEQLFCFQNSGFFFGGLDVLLVLKNNKRQNKDEISYIEALNLVRNRKNDDPQNDGRIYELLRPMIKPPGWDIKKNLLDCYNWADPQQVNAFPRILFSRNSDVNAINNVCFSRTQGEMREFDNETSFFRVRKTPLGSGRGWHMERSDERFDFTNDDVEALPPEDVWTFFAKDERGNYKPKSEKIYLKENCKVMLTVNLNEKLCNGSCGTMIGYSKKSGHPVVEFQNGEIRTISPQVVGSFQCRKGARLFDFEVKRIPLILAYALTVHKSQGLTLDRVIFFCGDCFADAQFYVGISRTRFQHETELVNFSFKSILTNDAALNFYSQFSKSPFDDEVPASNVVL